MNAHLDGRIGKVNAHLDSRIGKRNANLSARIADSKTELLTWMLGTLTALTALLAGHFKLLWRRAAPAGSFDHDHVLARRLRLHVLEHAARRSGSALGFTQPVSTLSLTSTEGRSVSSVTQPIRPIGLETEVDQRL